MYIALGIFIGLSVGGLGFAVYCGIQWHRVCRRNKKDLERFDRAEQLWYSEKQKLERELKETKDQIHREDLSDDRDVLNAQKKLILEDIESRRKELEEVTKMLRDTNLVLAHCKNAIIQGQSDVHDLKQQIAVLEPQKSNLETLIEKLNYELRRLLNLQKVVDTNEDNVVWAPILKEKELKLINLLQELINMYPDLKSDFATIEWKKIWLPRLQDLGKTIDGVRGIYRLILREEGNGSSAVAHFDVVDADGNTKTMPVCYVGQAVDIKDRWYIHVKKMIGVSPKGNEKVYDYRPEDFYWCIVEQGKDVILNESEKYWIQYFCAKDGLNKKL